MDTKKPADKHRKDEKGRNLVTDLCAAAVLSALIAWLFYRSFYGLLLYPLIAFLCHRYLGVQRKKKLEAEHKNEYRELLQSVGNSLSTGYSVENAFKEAEKELYLMYGKDAWILKELVGINRQVSLSMPVEKAFQVFAQQNPMEEILSFSEVFIFAKRLGGDYTKYLKRTAEKIGEKIELSREIDVMTAEKRAELLVMSVMPLGIILYNTLLSSEFLEPLYHNVGGVVMMTVVLLFYGLMIALGERIVSIEV